MLVTNVSNKSASVSILCVRLTIREMLRWSNLLNPFKKLKSFCKSKLQLSMKSMVKLFCEELKAKGSMTKFDLLEPYPSILMYDVTLVLPRKSAGRKIVFVPSSEGYNQISE